MNSTVSTGTVIISLENSVVHLLQRLEQCYAKQKVSIDLFDRKTTTFNHVPFFEALIGEIFNQTDHSFKTEDFDQATELLRQMGISPIEAEMISGEIFNNLLSQLTAFLPDATFSDIEPCQCWMLGDHDIVITVPPHQRSIF